MLSLRSVVAATLATALTFAAPGGARAQDKRAEDRHRPHDLILAVDVSFSMIVPYHNYRKAADYPPNDREGIRWDGIQFTIDVARDDDRIALVIYRAENVVITKYIDDSGFVGLDKEYDWKDASGNPVRKKGRQLLTELVKEIQQREQEWVVDVARRKKRGEAIYDTDYRVFDLKLFAGRPGAKVPLHHGTASLLALQTIERELLGELRKDEKGKARAWTFLFTDGEEEERYNKPKDGPFQYDFAEYSYIFARKKIEDSDVGRLRDLVEPRLQGFRKRNVPIFTFALGETCDRPLLESIAGRSASPDPQAMRGASYNAVSNLDLLRDLRYIQWELREYWVRELQPKVRDGGQELFYTPDVGAWHDVGVLLYRVRQGAGAKARALEPLREHMEDPRLGGRKLALEPRASRSHWYYALNPADPPPGAPNPLQGQLSLEVKRGGGPDGDYTTHCVLALSTSRPLFHYRQPTPDGGKPYSPRDVIPFQVDFTPYPVPTRGGGHDIPFRAEDFEVKVTLTPASRAAGNAAAPPPFTLDLDARPADKLVTRHFRKEIVLDSDPRSPGKKGLSGLYYVDVEIRGAARDRPLSQAVRRLIRRTLLIAPYPKIKVSESRVVLGNNKQAAEGKAIKVELDMRTDPKEILTAVKVKIEPGPVSAKGERIKPGHFTGFPAELTLRGREGGLEVSLPVEVWASLASGLYERGYLHFTTPWGTTAKTELVLRKGEYPLRVSPQLRLALAARGKNVERPGEVQVELDTDLPTREKVWLSDDDRVAADEVTSLTFHQVEDEKGVAVKGGKAFRFEITGLGEKYAVLARGPDADKKAALAFTLRRAGTLAPGVYEGGLYVVGPGVKSAAVVVKVAVNDMSVLDPAGRPVDEIYVLGLAGTDVTYPVTFRSARKVQQVKAVSVRKGWKPLDNKSPGGWDQLALAARPIAGAPGAALRVAVPLCVQEGEYFTEVTFEVTSVEGDDAPQKVPVTLPVFVEVRHKGVYFPPQDLRKGAVWLQFGDKKPTPEFAARELKLGTEATKAPVRWSVKRVTARPGPGKALEPADGHLDVLFEGASVLTREGGKGQADPGAARNPIKRGKECPLTFRASRKGLEPGLYRGTFRFRSQEDRDKVTEGLDNDLDVYVVVPGRGDVKASAVRGGPLYLGDEARVQVEVASYDCEPGQGTYRLLDGKEQPLGPAQPLGDEAKGEKDPAVPGKTLYRYPLTVTPGRPGTNFVEVRWPRYRPEDGPADDVAVYKLPLEVLGVIDVKSQAVGVGEEVTIRAKIDPSRPAEGGRLVLHVIDRAEKDRDPVQLELYDDGKAENGDERAGDGIYSLRYRFNGPGTYDVVFPGEAAPGPLRPAVVHVNYEFRPTDRAGTVQIGTLEYGSGTWLGWLGIREELSDPRAFELVNKRAERCRWRARLRFPKGGKEANQVNDQNVDSLPADLEADPRAHLDAHLAGPREDKLPPGWTAGGTLSQDGSVELGLEAKLSAAALEEAYGSSPAGAPPHPTLGKTSAMILEVQMEWLDEKGEVTDRRDLRMPFSVAARYWAMNPKPWILGGVFVVGLYVLGRVLLGSLRGRPKPAAAVSEDSMLTAPVTASPQPQPRRGGGGGPPPPPPPRRGGSRRAHALRRSGPWVRTPTLTKSCQDWNPDPQRLSARAKGRSAE